MVLKRLAGVSVVTRRCAACKRGRRRGRMLARDLWMRGLSVGEEGKRSRRGMVEDVVGDDRWKPR